MSLMRKISRTVPLSPDGAKLRKTQNSAGETFCGSIWHTPFRREVSMRPIRLPGTDCLTTSVSARSRLRRSTSRRTVLRQHMTTRKRITRNILVRKLWKAAANRMSSCWTMDRSSSARLSRQRTSTMRKVMTGKREHTSARI